MGVVREDVIKVTYDVQQNPFGDVNAEVRQMTSGVESVTRETKGLGSALSGAKSFVKEFTRGFKDGFQEAREQTRETNESVGEMKTGFSGIKGLLASLSMGALNKMKSALTSIAQAGIQKVLTGLDKLKQGLKNLPRAALDTLAKGFKAAGSAAVDAAGKITKFAGKAAIRGIAVASAAVIGLGTAAIGVGANFESSMSQVAATMGMTADEANYSNSQYALLANTAKEMGATTKFSASESAEALNYMALAGYDAEKSCAALPTVLNLAAAGGMELASASDMVTDSMSALGIEATTENLQTFGDQLAKTAQKSNTSVAQLGEAVLTVGGTAKTLAGGTTELNTLLGIIADNGVKGAEGGTALRNVMLSLQAPTDVAAKTMKQLGLNVYDAQGQMRPMNDILGDLNSSMANMSDQQKQDAISTIFNKNDLKSVNALLAGCGDRYDELSGYIENSSGAMKNMADTMNDNLNGRLTEFKSAAEGAGIAIYEALGSSNLKDIVKDATGWISELTEATETGGISGLAKAAGSVLSKALTEITSMMPDVIDTGVEIIDNLLDGIDSNSEEISNSAVKVGMSFLSGILRIVPKLITTGLKLVADLAAGIAQNFPAILVSGQQAIGNLLSGMRQTLPTLFASVGSILSQCAQFLMASAPTMVPSGISAVLNFIQGALAGLPNVLSMGVQLLSAVAQGIVASLPVVAQQGSQIVHDLISSIVGALPDLAVAIFNGLLGILQNLPSLLIGAVKGIGGGIVDGIKSWFTGDDSVAEAGVETASSVAAGITDNTAAVTTAMQTLSTDATEAFKIDTAAIQESTVTLGTDFSTGIQDQTPLIVTAATETTDETKEVFDGIDLTSSGVNAGQGFANGLISQKGQIMAQARDIADSVSNTVNSSLKIHSPSRVAMDTGENYDLGLIKGVENLKSKVSATASQVSSAVRGSYEPVRGSAGGSTVTTNRSSSQVNTFSPSFSLTLNGASASDSNQRKVKRWVKEALKEGVESMKRTNPVIQEV